MSCVYLCSWLGCYPRKETYWANVGSISVLRSRRRTHHCVNISCLQVYGSYTCLNLASTKTMPGLERALRMGYVLGSPWILTKDSHRLIPRWYVLLSMWDFIELFVGSFAVTLLNKSVLMLVFLFQLLSLICYCCPWKSFNCILA